MVRFRRGALAVLAAGTCAGCVGANPTTDVVAERPPEESPPPKPACRDAPASLAVAIFPGARCPWVLAEEGQTLRLLSLDLEPPPVKSGAVPDRCSQFRCRYEGAHASIGPVVLAIETSPQSEMPHGLHLGFAGGEALEFIDLWEAAGPPVLGDSTPLGPAHGLAPYVCDAGLALLVEARLEPAHQIEPPPELVAREGLYTPDLQTHQPADKLDRSKCDRIPISIP